MSDLLRIAEEQRLQLLIDAITDYAIYLLDATGRVATWNSGAERFKGYSAAEAIGEHFSRFFTDEGRAQGRPQLILDTAAREGRFEGEGWRVRKDGSRFLAHVVVDAIYGDKGELIGFAKVTRDITEKRAREQALYESEQQFRLLVQGVRDYAIYMLDTDGFITNWNAGAEAIKGYSADDIVGEHFSNFYTEEEKAAGEPQRALTTALREGKYEREAWRVRKDGSLFWAHVLLDPIYNEDGEHVGFAKVTRDITDQRKAQDELEATRAVLAQSQKMQALGELTGGIAHDFNNLMTVIAGSADFLLRKDGLPPDKQRQYLEAIAETAGRATTLTNHLLAFGRRQAIRPEVIDLNLRLDALADVLSRTLGSKVRIRLKLASEAAMVEVDAAQLETAILNAALNARDAMADGGTLTIGTAVVREKAGETVQLTIADSGPGMPQEVIDRAFEPFFTTKEVGKGTGLGLSQIHGFAAQAGGVATISSKNGEGTTLTIALPRSAKPSQPAAAEARLSEVPEGLTVLLVEDNAQVRVFAEGLLRDLGCKVVSADNGEQALSILKGNDISLVVSDVVMPGMSGIDLARKLLAIDPEMPVLLATGYSDDIRKSGCEFPVLAKPFGASELSKAIAKLLAESRNRAA